MEPSGLEIGGVIRGEDNVCSGKGVAGSDKLLVNESPASFKLHANGHRNLEGAVITMTLLRRHEMVSSCEILHIQRMSHCCPVRELTHLCRKTIKSFCLKAVSICGHFSLCSWVNTVDHSMIDVSRMQNLPAALQVYSMCFKHGEQPTGGNLPW